HAGDERRRGGAAGAGAVCGPADRSRHRLHQRQARRAAGGRRPPEKTFPPPGGGRRDPAGAPRRRSPAGPRRGAVASRVRKVQAAGRGFPNGASTRRTADVASALAGEERMAVQEIPAGGSWSGVVKRGEVLKIVDVEGQQGVDFLCYSAADPEERY